MSEQAIVQIVQVVCGVIALAVVCYFFYRMGE